MNDPVNKALLPDGLPPDAAHEAAVLGRLVASLAARGYERAGPPLVVFEDSLQRRLVRPAMGPGIRGARSDVAAILAR